MKKYFLFFLVFGVVYGCGEDDEKSKDTTINNDMKTDAAKVDTTIGDPNNHSVTLIFIRSVKA